MNSKHDTTVNWPLQSIATKGLQPALWLHFCLKQPLYVRDLHRYPFAVLEHLTLFHEFMLTAPLSMNKLLPPPVTDMELRYKERFLKPMQILKAAYRYTTGFQQLSKHLSVIWSNYTLRYFGLDMGRLQLLSGPAAQSKAVNWTSWTPASALQSNLSFLFPSFLPCNKVLLLLLSILCHDYSSAFQYSYYLSANLVLVKTCFNF